MIYRFQMWDLQPIDETIKPYTGYASEPLVGDEIVGDRGGIYRVVRRRHIFHDSPYSNECHELLFSLEYIQQPPPKPEPVPVPPNFLSRWLLNRMSAVL